MPAFSEVFFKESCDILQIDKTVESTCQLASQNPQTLYIFIQRYTHFNGYAGSLVARLASSIGLSRHLFRCSSSLITDESDRGIEIAAKVLAATIDEHCDSKVKVASHRLLAQFLLKSVGDYANLSVTKRNCIAVSPSWMEVLVEELIEGYQGAPNSIPALVKAMGFHVASEMLADREFVIIDKVIRHDNNGHGFDHYLRTSADKFRASKHQYSPWYWIIVHGKFEESGVEAEHFQLAIEALNLATECRPESSEEFREWALQGFLSFVEIQDRLFTRIYEECLFIHEEQSDEPCFVS